MMGSLHTYASNMKMQMKWEQKKSKGDYSADGTTSIAEQLRKEAGGIGTGTSNRSQQAILNGIRTKLNAGKRLSSSELEYLKKNDPETYQHVKAMEMERKAYEQRLKNCKTKEEVQRLKASQMASSLDRVREVNNNPNIPDDEKLKLTLQEHQKVCSVTDAKPADAQIAKAKELLLAAKKTRIEAELTPEAQKVRRSKAKAAYVQNMDINGASFAPAIDIES